MFSRITALACFVLLTFPAMAPASTSSDAINAVNGLRARMGVVKIVNDATLASDCAAHVTYMTANSTVTHTELPSAPSYDSHGADAAPRSVLSFAFPFVPQTTAATIHWYPGSPIHLFQLLQPGLLRSGYAAGNNYACMTVTNLAQRPSIKAFNVNTGKNKLATFPEHTATRIPTREDTHLEAPSPNAQVGLPAAQVTGPYLLLFARGFGAPSACRGVRFTSVSLKDQRGRSVKVRKFDDADAMRAAGLPATSSACLTIGGGGYVVPERPLAAATRYTVTAKVVGRTAPTKTKPKTFTWQFATLGSTDRAKPTARFVGTPIWSVAKGRVRWSIGAKVTDASLTWCTARVGGRSVRCVVAARGRITLVGSRAGSPSTLPVSITVKDVAGNVGSRLSRTLR